MNSSTITASTFTLTGPGNTAVCRPRHLQHGHFNGDLYAQCSSGVQHVLHSDHHHGSDQLRRRRAGLQLLLDLHHRCESEPGDRGLWHDLSNDPRIRRLDCLAGSVNYPAGHGTVQPDDLYGLERNICGLGLSILRVRIDPSGTSTTTPCLGYRGNWAQELTNAQEAMAANKNAIVFASPWTPPPSMKSNNSTVEGTLNTSEYGAYAAYLEDFVNYFATNNAPLYAVSMQNEPDANVTYESCSWTGTTMDQWVASLTANGATDPLTTRLMMPESEGFNTSYSNPTLADPNAVGNVSIIAGHLYGVTPSYQTNAENAGKEVWMTEHSTCEINCPADTIADALASAEEVHNSMTVGQYNAYVWWWIWNDDCDTVNYGLITDGTGVSGNGCGTSAQPAPTFYGYGIGQFSEFIQPGFVRVSATANPISGVYVSAYNYTGSIAYPDHYVIVAINSNTSSESLTFVLNNGTVTSLTPYRTTSAGGLASQSAVSVSSGQFNYTLPAQSIVTFVQ